MDIALAKRLFLCIDHTTLTDIDTEQSVVSFCRRALEYGEPSVAAVCVYPRFVECARKTLGNSGIKVASVAGAFPHGQLPIELKVNEVKYALDKGADEVDMVLSRGVLLEGDYNRVRDEVAMMKEACQGHTLKVILETGELPSPTLIRMASELAIEGGADFIKTSTGKIATGATLEAAEVMLHVIADYVKINKRTVGFKAAGGVSTPEQAAEYAKLAQKIVGEYYIDKQYFRIGTSRLTETLFSLLTN